MVDGTNAIACISHAQQRVPIVIMDQLTYKHPIKIGDLVIFEGEVCNVIEFQVRRLKKSPKVSRLEVKD